MRVPDLGPRGEGWVVGQFVLIGAVVACGLSGVQWPAGLEPFAVVLGLVLAASGLILLALGFVTLGRLLTPLPRPRRGGRLRRSGIYRRVRHPIYGGVILLTLGWSLAAAPLALVPTALLAVLFDLKARREEAWLLERYPEYEQYRAETPHRFLPGVL
jgi:protein-S-isoprenylcysteine O-methyltransferase Ste14